MRRVPYIQITDNKLYYICPKCKHVIPRDLYVLQDWCPSCEHPINRISKSMMTVYEILDKEFYTIFIQQYKEE